MNYVFLDTCSWIDFACGKDANSKLDVTNSNIVLLESLNELIQAKRMVFLKNEIVELEFKEASTEKLIEHFDKQYISRIRTDIKDKILVHSNSSELTEIIDKAILGLDSVKSEFLRKASEFNQGVRELFRLSFQINVSERLKQRALNHSIQKNHILFESNKNNVNDFLILYSIQEWIENTPELRDLDETDENHAIYFVTKNAKDFKVDINSSSFDESLMISQLITPVRNIHDLLSYIKKVENNWDDFLPYKSSNVNNTHNELSLVERMLENKDKLIELKRELLLSFIDKHLSRIQNEVKIKYVGEVLGSKNTELSAGEVPMIRTQNIVNQKLIDTNLLKVKKSDGNIETHHGDFLITSFGVKAGEHCLNQLDYKAYVHPNIYVLRFEKSKVDLQFAHYALQSLDLESLVDRNKFKYHIPRLSLDEVNNSRIKLPPMDVQVSLAQLFLEKEAEIEQDIIGIKYKTHSVIS